MLHISLITLSGAANISDRITSGLLLTSKSLINLLRRRLAEFRGAISDLEFKIFKTTISGIFLKLKDQMLYIPVQSFQLK